MILLLSCLTAFINYSVLSLLIIVVSIVFVSRTAVVVAVAVVTIIAVILVGDVDVRRIYPGAATS